MLEEYDDGTDYGGSYSFEDERYGGGGRRRGGHSSYERQTTQRYHSSLALRGHFLPPILSEKKNLYFLFRPRPPVTEERREEPAEAEDPDGCGPECRNLLHESDHRKEDSKCPHEGMVIDIYGYCRQDDFEV